MCHYWHYWYCFLCVARMPLTGSYWLKKKKMLSSWEWREAQINQPYRNLFDKFSSLFAHEREYMSFGAVAVLDQENPEGPVLPDGFWPPSDLSFVFKQVCLSLYLIFVSLCLCLMISLFCFNADTVHLRWKQWCWALRKWWQELPTLAFSGSGFRG